MLRAWELLRPTFELSHPGGKIHLRNVEYRTRGIVEWSPGWKNEVIRRIISVRPNGVFIDVGANLGQTLLDYHAATDKGEYLGFEPSPLCVNHLQGLITKSNLPRSKVVPAALSDTNGVIELHADWSGDPTAAEATIVADLRPGRSYGTQFIACLRFDDIVAEVTSRQIAFIKIDVEGAELQTLRGMAATIRSQQPWIMCEVLRRDGRAPEAPYAARMKELTTFIADAGYDIYAVEKSQDCQRFVGLRRVTAFPLDAWSHATQEDNDYLLVPAFADPQSQLGLPASH